MELSCEVIIKIDGKNMDRKDIIERVFSLDKNSISYSSSEIKTIKVPGKKKGELVDGHELSTLDTIGDKYNFNGIYFIFSEDATKLLYLGKGNAKTRLTQHLIRGADSNSSKMEQVSEYLKDHETNTLQYAFIKVDVAKNTTAIESELIDYVSNNKKIGNKLSLFFNERNG